MKKTDEDLIHKYIENRCTVKELDEILQRLKSDTGFRALWLEFVKNESVLWEMAKEGMLSDIASHQQLEASAGESRHPLMLWKALTAAAAILMAVMLWYGIFHEDKDLKGVPHARDVVAREDSRKPDEPRVAQAEEDQEDFAAMWERAVSQSETARKPKDIFVWGAGRVMQSGLVLAKLDLTDDQQASVQKIFLQKRKAVINNYMKGVVTSCGECPLMAIRTNKYVRYSPEEFCVWAEAGHLMQKPVENQIKMLLTQAQKEKYEKGLALLMEYSARLRKHMKARSSQEVLQKIQQEAGQKIDQIFAS